jgi:hypothetical protein
MAGRALANVVDGVGTNPQPFRLQVVRFVFKLPTVAMDRDAVCGMLTKVSSNGDGFCISRSVDWPDEEQHSSKLIRAEVETSGFLIQPATETESLVTYLNQVNLKGNLPQVCPLPASYAPVTCCPHSVP